MAKTGEARVSGSVYDVRANPVMSSRVDVLRILMLLFVVLWHNTPTIVESAQYSYAWDWFRTVVTVPKVFLIPSCLMVLTTITGYILFSNTKPRPYLQSAQIWARSLLIPFFTFGLPIVVLMFVLQYAGGAADFRYQLFPWS